MNCTSSVKSLNTSFSRYLNIGFIRILIERTGRKILTQSRIPVFYHSTSRHHSKDRRQSFSATSRDSSTLLHPSPDTTCGYFIIPYFIFRSFEKATLRDYRSKDGQYNIQLVETHTNSFCRVQEFLLS